MERFKRVFVVVMDSLGVGAMPDSADFGDIGVNTLGHISESVDTFQDSEPSEAGYGKSSSASAGVAPVEAPMGYYGKLERSQPRKGYHDRTLGDDGTGSHEAV